MLQLTPEAARAAVSNSQSNFESWEVHGFKLSYSDEGAYFYVRKNPNGSYSEMRLLPSDMTLVSFELMARLGLTNNNKKVKP